MDLVCHNLGSIYIGSTIFLNLRSPFGAQTQRVQYLVTDSLCRCMLSSELVLGESIPFVIFTESRTRSELKIRLTSVDKTSILQEFWGQYVPTFGVPCGILTHRHSIFNYSFGNEIYQFGIEQDILTRQL